MVNRSKMKVPKVATNCRTPQVTTQRGHMTAISKSGTKKFGMLQLPPTSDPSNNAPPHSCHGHILLQNNLRYSWYQRKLNTMRMFHAISNALFQFSFWQMDNTFYIISTSTDKAFQSRAEFVFSSHSGKRFRLGGCDANALAGCMDFAASSGSLSFVDLDEANFDTFHPFHRFKGNEIRLLLYYQPTFLDRFFLSKSTNSSLELDDGISKLKVGRVDCSAHPRLCLLNGPELLPLLPRDYPTNIMYQGDYGHQGDYGQVFAYPVGVKECLWRRHGADALTATCKDEMNHHGRHKVPHSERFQNEGKIIAAIHNILSILMCLVLLCALVLVGWRLLRKCLARCGFANVVAKNSAQMTKQERKQQLEQQIACFYFAAFAFSLAGLFMPGAVMTIGGPIALVALFWLWCVELQAARPSCDCSSKQSREIPTADDMKVSLLPTEETVATV